ncbi:predicted protein [Sclerotinia sclerotiorum 1980 UF-70]|uniref:Uncharacterized protein n=1 Tax=Sclerotinia sclerotiorum (strain ATCC 18683 / 1980 / Ss-1) TaxID=665079 RepID=A7EEY7_SCLS1|nr:predicted protein [Sclerotinia sclerotiorum 1980 UF-70]EDO01403.1 predicted protein [Sclerotinia sclerotiorum 1980 UF-70]
MCSLVIIIPLSRRAFAVILPSCDSIQVELLTSFISGRRLRDATKVLSLRSGGSIIRLKACIAPLRSRSHLLSSPTFSDVQQIPFLLASNQCQTSSQEMSLVSKDPADARNQPFLEVSPERRNKVEWSPIWTT